MGSEWKRISTGNTRSLSYRGFGGKISHWRGGAYASANGCSVLLRDRGWLGLTIKASL